MSAGATEWVTPDRPPMVNIATVATANFIATVKRNLPPHIVANQFSTFTPVGTAMNIVESEKAATDRGPIPETNM